MTSNLERNKLRDTFRPEFLNRIDEIVTFDLLTQADIEQIVELQFNGVAQRLRNGGLQIAIEREAVKWIAQRGYDPDYGARPIKRALQTHVLNELSRQILAGYIDKSRPINISVHNDALTFN